MHKFIAILLLMNTMGSTLLRASEASDEGVKLDETCFAERFASDDEQSAEELHGREAAWEVAKTVFVCAVIGVAAYAGYKYLYPDMPGTVSNTDAAKDAVLVPTLQNQTVTGALAEFTEQISTQTGKTIQKATEGARSLAAWVVRALQTTTPTTPSDSWDGMIDHTVRIP